MFLLFLPSAAITSVGCENSSGLTTSNLFISRRAGRMLVNAVSVITGEGVFYVFFFCFFLMFSYTCFRLYILGIIWGLFGLTPSSVFFYKSLSRRFPRRCILPFPRTPLHNLLAFIHPEVVPVSLQFPSQRLYRIYQFSFHIKNVF